MIKIDQTKSDKYPPRTYHNAKAADLTVAFAIDFNTSGEKLTKKAAGDKYISVDITKSAITDAQILFNKIYMKRNLWTLNIAGNSLNTFTKYRSLQDESIWSQELINKYIYTIIKFVHEQYPILKIVSGGQTGVDFAGGVAANKLGIDCTMTFPAGYLQRGLDGIDHTNIESDIYDRINYYTSLLNN